MKFINNDTIALVFLGTVAIIGTLSNMETVVTASLGAIAGYVGSKAIDNKGGKE